MACDLSNKHAQTLEVVTRVLLPPIQYTVSFVLSHPGPNSSDWSFKETQKNFDPRNPCLNPRLMKSRLLGST